MALPGRDAGVSSKPIRRRIVAGKAGVAEVHPCGSAEVAAEAGFGRIRAEVPAEGCERIAAARLGEVQAEVRGGVPRAILLQDAAQVVDRLLKLGVVGVDG